MVVDLSRYDGDAFEAALDVFYGVMDDLKMQAADGRLTLTDLEDYRSRIVRETYSKLAEMKEPSVFDHPQDMFLDGNDWHPLFKITPTFGDGRFLLTIQLGSSYGLSFHCSSEDLIALAGMVGRALEPARLESDDSNVTRPSGDLCEPRPTTSIRRDLHTSPQQDRLRCGSLES